MEDNDWRKKYIENNKRNNKRRSRVDLIFALGVISLLIVLNLIFNWTGKIINDDDNQNKVYDNRGGQIDE